MAYAHSRSRHSINTIPQNDEDIQLNCSIASHYVDILNKSTNEGNGEENGCASPITRSVQGQLLDTRKCSNVKGSSLRWRGANVT